MLLVALVLGWSAGDGRAQSGDSPRADRQVTVTLDGSGPYLASMGPLLTGAYDRMMQDIDGASEQASPDDVKNATFRRRILEMRLLMDFGAYAYDPILLPTFRKAVDAAYEQTGDYQDVAVTQTLLQFSVRPEVTSQRLIKMNVVLASLRAPTVRSAMRSFLAAPSGSLQTLDQNDVPRLWAMSGTTPSTQLDTVGNVALLGARVLRAVQGSDPFVADIFDRPQELKFHLTRKDTRSAMLLALMFPETRDATRVTSEPLFSLISQYGDVNDAVVAYRTAQSYGGPVDAGANLLRSEFLKSQADQGNVVNTGAFDGVAGKLDRVQQEHRR